MYVRVQYLIVLLLALCFMLAPEVLADGTLAQTHPNQYKNAVGNPVPPMSSDPGDTEGLRQSGLAHLQNYDFQSAIVDFENAQKNLPPYTETGFPGYGEYASWMQAQSDFLEGNLFWKDKAYDHAIRLYNAALASYPSYPQALHNLSIVLARKHQYDDAINDVELAISYRYSDWKFWNTLGYDLYQRKKLKEARDAWDMALGLNPPDKDKADIFKGLQNVNAGLEKVSVGSFFGPIDMGGSFR